MKLHELQRLFSIVLHDRMVEVGEFGSSGGRGGEKVVAYYIVFSRYSPY